MHEAVEASLLEIRYPRAPNGNEVFILIDVFSAVIIDWLPFASQQRPGHHSETGSPVPQEEPGILQIGNKDALSRKRTA
jgi:hypothetical protein